MKPMIALLYAALCSLVCLLAVPACAHDLGFAKVDVVFDEEGRFEATMRSDIDALLLGKDAGHLENADWKALEELAPGDVQYRLANIAETLRGKTDFLFDGHPATFEVSFPDYADGRMNTAGVRLDYSEQTFSRRVVMSGIVPDGAQSFTWRGRGMGNIALSIQRGGDGAEPVIEALMPDAESSAFALRGPQREKTALQSIAEYFVLGYAHIIPNGLDHILFVVCLFLLSQRLSMLLWQTTAFTIAHSITLILSVYEVANAPSFIVETVIALSIVYVAVENILTRDMHWWRPVVIFAFGLLHGLGFAGSLREIGLPTTALLPSLLSFNVGIEVGQISVIALSFLAVGWFREKEWYQWRVVTPISLCIALIALVWAFQRFTGGLMS